VLEKVGWLVRRSKALGYRRSSLTALLALGWALHVLLRRIRGPLVAVLGAKGDTILHAKCHCTAAAKYACKTCIYLGFGSFRFENEMYVISSNRYNAGSDFRFSFRIPTELPWMRL
jgi:hypothetical protein